MTDFSIFGEMDAAAIADDPWAIADDWYRVDITKSYIEQFADIEGIERVEWRITYMVDEPDSKYHQRPVREKFEIFPWAKSTDDLSPEQQTQVERMKQRMVKGMGLAIEDIRHYSRNIEELVGRSLYIRVKNNPGKVGTQYEGQTFANVVDARFEPPGNRFAAVEKSMF